MKPGASVIALLLLLGIAAADQIRVEHREGSTGNFAPVNLTTLTGYVLTFDAGGNPIIAAQTGGSGLTDGNKGDISVAGSGANWVINPASVTLGKMANLAPSKLIGRATASTGVPEAITVGPDFSLAGSLLSLVVTPQPIDADLTDLADGTLGESKIDAAIARDAEVTAAIAAAGAGYQPLDADLTDLAGLSAAQGDIVIGNGTGDWTKLAKGTANQVLRMNAGATLPEWTGLPAEWAVAVSDETTALTTGAAKVTFRMPYAMTLTSVRASVGTAPTGSTIVVDINEGGSTIMTTTKLSIDATEKTSTTAAAAAALTDTALADDAEITVDVDAIGATVAGAGLKVLLKGTR